MGRDAGPFGSRIVCINWRLNDCIRTPEALGCVR